MSEILNSNSLEFEYKLLQLKHQKFQIEYVKIKAGYEERIVDLEGKVQQQSNTIEQLKNNLVEITSQAKRLYGDYTQLKTAKSSEVALLENTVADIESRYCQLNGQLGDF